VIGSVTENKPRNRYGGNRCGRQENNTSSGMVMKWSCNGHAMIKSGESLSPPLMRPSVSKCGGEESPKGVFIRVQGEPGGRRLLYPTYLSCLAFDRSGTEKGSRRTVG
jgi:hypothetical protein